MHKYRYAGVPFALVKGIDLQNSVLAIVVEGLNDRGIGPWLGDRSALWMLTLLEHLCISTCAHRETSINGFTDLFTQSNQFVPGAISDVHRTERNEVALVWPLRWAT